MALKSYTSFKKKKKKKSPARDLITAGVTAVIGLGLLGATSKAVSNI